MKKSKALAALAAAAVLAVGGVAAGCGGGHTHTYSEDWEKDETGHWHVATCDDLKESDKDYKSGFAAHVWGNDNECDVCHYIKVEQGHTHTYTAWDSNDTQHWKKCPTDGEVDESTKANHNYVNGKCECGKDDPNGNVTPTPAEYTITLHVGNGTLPAGAATTYKTNAEGKIDGTLPVATIGTAHMSFGGWYTAEVGGTEVDERTATFTENTDLYAQYIRDDGVWLGDTYKAGLTRNTGETTGIQYWLGGGSITLAEDDVISLYMGGKLISYYVIKSSAGIDKPAESANVNSVTVTVAGEFKIYLWDWTTESDPNNWSCEFAGPTKVEVGSEIPEGCDAVHITIGTNEVTLYLKDASGNPIGADDFSNYCIYIWNGGQKHFGDWNGCTTTGVLAAEMTSATVTVMPEAWIFRWGNNFGTQSGNLSGIEAGGTYLIELAQGAGTVTKLELGA